MRYCIALISLAFASVAWSQTASITGRVTDATGAVVPGASVKAQSVATGVSTATETNGEGYYNIRSVQPGNYNLTVEKSGFSTVRETNLALSVQQVARVDIALQVGAISDRVEVSARAVMLDSETSALGQVVGSSQIANLPLLGRNAYALAGMVPGVRVAAGVNDLPVDQISTTSASINGQRGDQNEYLLDGAPNTAAAQNQPVIYANVDSVQEFKVETNGFSAEYGRTAGGVFNVVTKSGTNDVHFTAYDYFRNTVLNANDWFANRSGKARAPFNFNQFGGTIGGPLVIPKLYNGKDRTFFFGSIELVRFIQGITFNGTVPRPEQLGGDFSDARNAAGNVVPIYDPLSVVPGSSTRTPFAGNRIPSTRFDPVARNIVKYWPAPNAAGVALTGANNFVRTASNGIRKDTFSLRFDHNFSQTNHIFARFSYDDSPLHRAASYGPEYIASPSAGPQVFSRRNAVVEDTQTFTPTMLGTLRASFARLSNFRRPFSDGFDITTLGFPAGLGAQIGDPAAFPAITVAGYNATGTIANTVVGGALGANDTIAFGMDQGTLVASITKSFSTHTLKTGFEFRVIRANLQQHGDTGTTFGFAANWTQGPGATTGSNGLALASLLLGLGSGSVSPAPALAHQTLYYAGFVQDDWKVTSKLTVNLGLRYDYETPRMDRFDQLTNFDYSQKAPLTAPGLNINGVLTFVGVNGASRYQANPDRNNFAPRGGLAYKLTPRTVIRTGGGIFYAATTGLGGGFGAFGVSGFSAVTNQVTSLDSITPITYLRNPFPGGILKPTGNTLGAATLLGQAITFFDRGNRVPYSAQWNFNVQHQLPRSILFDIGYAGSRGLKFPQNLTMNQLPDSALALGSGLNTLVPNPFYGQITSGPLSSATIARGRLLRPYPQFDQVTSANANWASSSYHALEVKVEKRSAKGLTIMGSYTYSKIMDYANGNWGGEPLGGGTLQNFNNLRADRSVSQLDQTHRFVINGVYELPFAKSLHGVAAVLAKGWEIGGVYSRFSGGPIGLTAAPNNTNSLGGNSRPNWTGISAKLDNPTPDRWFDISQFANPAAYTFGNAARSFNNLRSDGTSNIDISLHKNTNLTEKLKLQFRAEFFNFTNTVRFSPPSSATGNAQFGTVSSQGNQPRIIQFALKLLM